MSEFDPYAPPAASEDAVAGRPRKKKKRSRAALEEALARLDEHLTDADKVAVDREAEGSRLRRVTVGFLAFGVVVAALGLVVGLEDAHGRLNPLALMSLTVGGFVALMGVLSLVMDLRIQPRARGSSPEDTLKFFFRAMALARYGYAWTCLSPTARDEDVKPPQLGPIPTGMGDFCLRSPEVVKSFAGTFLRPGGGQMRSMELKSFRVLEQDGDVARVEVHAIFQAWPQWLSAAGGVAAVMIRNLGLIGAVVAVVCFALIFVLRKRYEVRFKRTLLRGRNGAWYLYKADIFEDGPEEG